MATEEEGNVQIDSNKDREGSPDEDFPGQKNEKDDESSSDSDSDSAESDVERTKSGGERKRKGEEVLNLEQDEAKELLEDLGTDVRQGKRIRRPDNGEAANQGNGINANDGPSSQSDEIWRSIQEGKDAKKDSNTITQKEEMVTVLRTYKFAGEEVVKEEMLPASDPFAKQYLAKQAQAKAQSSAEASSNPSSITANTRPTQGPGPRRKKGGGLAAMSAAVVGKPDKLNTLEKSKMDWTKYKDSTLSEQERHEMEAQTKGGSSGLGSMKGYMERRNFLERVQDRLEGQEK